MRLAPVAEVRLEEDKAASSSTARRATIASAAGRTHRGWNLVAIDVGKARQWRSRVRGSGEYRSN